MRRIVIFSVAAVVALFVLAGETFAGEGGPTLVITPNPAQEGDSITIQNAPDSQSTCEFPGEKIEVTVTVDDEPDNVVFQTFTSPTDEAGNWSVTIEGGLPFGNYDVTAHCPGTFTTSSGFEGSAPEAFGPFDYADALLVIGGEAGPVDPNAVQDTPPAAVPVSVGPAFTG